MNQMDDRRLDELLAGHFSRELDAHAGRAAQAFAARAMPQRRNRMMIWSIGAGMAAAAMIAVAFLLHRVPEGGQIAGPATGGTVPTTVAVDAPYVERAVTWQTLDEGLVPVSDNAMARQVRERTYEQVRWTDPASNVQMEITIPRERVIFSELQMY
jgi:hypothetical protein